MPNVLAYYSPLKKVFEELPPGLLKILRVFPFLVLTTFLDNLSVKITGAEYKCGKDSFGSKLVRLSMAIFHS